MLYAKYLIFSARLSKDGKMLKILGGVPFQHMPDWPISQIEHPRSGVILNLSDYSQVAVRTKIVSQKGSVIT